MAIGRPWRAIVRWFNYLIGRERQSWVEPGNAITRAVLSGAELSLPELPTRYGHASPPLPVEAAAGAFAAPPQPSAEAQPAAPGTADEQVVREDGTKPGRWRAA